MSNLLKDFQVDAKNPSLEARQRWRSSVSIVKNRARRFRMISNLDDLAENEKKRCQIQVCCFLSPSLISWFFSVLRDAHDRDGLCNFRLWLFNLVILFSLCDLDFWRVLASRENKCLENFGIRSLYINVFSRFTHFQLQFPVFPFTLTV